jgi:hypothetical protein
LTIKLTPNTFVQSPSLCATTCALCCPSDIQLSKNKSECDLFQDRPGIFSEADWTRGMETKLNTHARSL